MNDTFNAMLAPLSHLGDAFVETGSEELYKPLLVRFSNACIEALFVDSSNSMDETEKQKFGQGRPPEQKTMFRKCRDLNFKNAVKDAAGRGVRYAGMGLNHLESLLRDKDGLPENSHAYDMAGVDISRFRAGTKKLKDKVKQESLVERFLGLFSAARPAGSNEPVAGPSTKPQRR
ncbi:MAG TPA: hypothetical protein VH165_06215 [Kofleriaceae bacterium]|jgi:hypothetical protein|nr:hypothetical protein [Kofleriaceae bacterium]